MNDDKILIEIPSYHDSELFNTINSAIIQSDNPDRVYFAVCYQGDDEEDYKKLKKIANCKIKWLKEVETKGLCYARDLCQKMIDDEKYVYQIDSHMRFVKHWDTKLIEELLNMKIKNYISFNKNSHYCEIFNKISKNIGDDYITVVDSSFRFLNGWDKYLLDNLVICGSKSMLTSWVWKTDDNTIKDF